MSNKTLYNIIINLLRVDGSTTHVRRYAHEASHPVHATTLREIFVLL